MKNRNKDYSIEEILDYNSLIDKLKDFENEFLFLDSNDDSLIKGIFTSNKMEVNDMQILKY